MLLEKDRQRVRVHPPHRLMLESSEDAASTMAESKMARLMARTQHAADFRREGGINTASADDALATMAEEQAHRVSKAHAWSQGCVNPKSEHSG